MYLNLFFCTVLYVQFDLTETYDVFKYFILSSKYKALL